MTHYKTLQDSGGSRCVKKGTRRGEGPLLASQGGGGVGGGEANMGLFMHHKALQKGGERVKVGFPPPTKGAGATKGGGGERKFLGPSGL